MLNFITNCIRKILSELSLLVKESTKRQCIRNILHFNMFNQITHEQVSVQFHKITAHLIMNRTKA